MMIDHQIKRYPRDSLDSTSAGTSLTVSCSISGVISGPHAYSEWTKAWSPKRTGLPEPTQVRSLKGLDVAADLCQNHATTSSRNIPKSCAKTGTHENAPSPSIFFDPNLLPTCPNPSKPSGLKSCFHHLSSPSSTCSKDFSFILFRLLLHHSPLVSRSKNPTTTT